MIDDFDTSKAVKAFRELCADRFGKQSFPAAMALVLGSGFNPVLEAVSDKIVLKTSEINGFPSSTVKGHDGAIVFGKLNGTEVLILSGRIHAYEGHPIRSLGLFVELCSNADIGRIIFTNAAGSMVMDMPPGSVMFIEDQINMSFKSPLRGPVAELGQRFPDMCEPFDLAWTEKSRKACLKKGLETFRGVYLWTMGPCYESKAEINFFRFLGADVVGMSTVGEVIKAKELGLSVLGLSLISNHATGLSPQELSHQEVLQSGNDVKDNLVEIISCCL